MKPFLRGFSFALVAAPLAAHHSTTPFDLTKEFTVSGTVTEFRWSNPHSYILLDSIEADGKLHHWLLEAEALNLLTRNGWKKDSLKSGDQISCLGARAKDPSTRAMKCFVLKFPDGRRLVATPTGVPTK